MLNPIFWKKVQAKKHHGRWEIEERKIPSVEMLFKTNTNGHKHPSISLFILEQDTNGETKENNKWHSTQEPHTPQNSPIDCDGVQLHQYRTTLPVYVYIRHMTRTRINNAYVCINTHQRRVSGREQRSSGGNTSSNPQVSALIPRPIGWGGCASAMGVIKLPPSWSSPKLISQSIQ